MDDQNNKRTRRESRKEIEDLSEAPPSWRSYIVCLGDRHAATEPNEQLEACSKILNRNIQDTLEDMVNLIVQCAEELPQKAPYYATLVAVIGVEYKPVFDSTLRFTHEGIQSALDSGNGIKLRLLLRFLTLLTVSRVVSVPSLLSVLSALVSRALATISKGSEPAPEAGNASFNRAWQPCADHYVYSVLAALPFCGQLVSQDESFPGLLSDISQYLTVRERLQHAGRQTLTGPLELLAQNSKEVSMEEEPQKDYIEDLWARIEWLQENQWDCSSSIPAPHLHVSALLDSLEPSHFPAVTVPAAPAPLTGFSSPALAFARQNFDALQQYPPRFWRLAIFPPAKTSEGMSVMDRFLVEEYVTDALYFLNGCRRECAAYLVGLPVKFRYEYVMSETIFSLLLLLPHSPARCVYYTVVMMDLCKALPSAFPVVVCHGVRYLYSLLPQMDCEVSDRLVLWMSHHLSNFSFVWQWEKWSSVLALPESHPQRRFVKQVLDRLVRLSYWDKVKESLQDESMAALLPPHPTPRNKYGKAPPAAPKATSDSDSDSDSDGDKAGAGKEAPAGATAGSTAAEEAEAGEDPPSEEERELSAELTRMVREKHSPAAIQLWLDSQVSSGALSAERCVDLVAHTLLFLGAKSFTHSMMVLERYGAILRHLAPSRSLQQWMVHCVVRLWRDSPQMAAVVVDRCMGFKIVSNLAIVDWVFSADTAGTFHTASLPWEVLRNALNKTRHRTADLRSQLEASRQELLHTKLQDKGSQNGTAQASVEAAQDSVLASEMLMTKALQEQEELFVWTLRNFVDNLAPGMERLDALSAESGQGGDSNGAHLTFLRSAEEAKAWVEAVLGQLRSICRFYAAEIWPFFERIEREVLTKEVDSRICQVALSGLGYRTMQE